MKRVSLHEPLTGLLRVTLITIEKGTPRTEIWRALYGAAFFKGDCGKICIAVNDDIDPDNADALLWAMAYPHESGRGRAGRCRIAARATAPKREQRAMRKTRRC